MEDVYNKNFLGQGWAFPLQVTAQGSIALAKGEEDIRQAILLILETIPGERKMRPEFGCGIHELVFAPRNAETVALMRSHIATALARWEPRIDVNKIDIYDSESNPDNWMIDITYTIRQTHSQRSIVYPFFLNDER